MQKHLAIFEAGLALKILSGEKTIEARFSKSKIAPYGVVSMGDLVYIKPVGKDITGQFRVRKVLSWEGLEREDVREIRGRYGSNILAPEEFWESKGQSSFVTLIFIEAVVPLITSPINLAKKDLHGWVVLDRD
jgi:hypothetical protein